MRSAQLNSTLKTTLIIVAGLIVGLLVANSIKQQFDTNQAIDAQDNYSSQVKACERGNLLRGKFNELNSGLDTLNRVLNKYYVAVEDSKGVPPPVVRAAHKIVGQTEILEGSITPVEIPVCVDQFPRP
jgi:hypothetical protein